MSTKRAWREDTYSAPMTISGSWTAAHDNRAVDGNVHAAKFLGAFFDGNGPGLFSFTLSAHQANACFHDGEKEQVEQRYEKQSAYEKDYVDHGIAYRLKRV